MGYYSLELDAILAYGPAEQYAHTVGAAIASEHPGRTVMRTGQSLVGSGTMVRGDILNAMLPLVRGGEVYPISRAIFDKKYVTTHTPLMGNFCYALVVLPVDKEKRVPCCRTPRNV